MRIAVPTTALAVALSIASSPIQAQIRVPRIIATDSDNLPRRPNDQIEGTIFEYTAVRSESSEDLSGRFRIEERGIYSVSREVAPQELRRAVRDALANGNRLSLPTTPQENRIGDVIPMMDGRYKLDFVDFEDLPGFAVIWPKKDRPGVWMGYFQELTDGKSGERWTIEIRESQD